VFAKRVYGLDFVVPDPSTRFVGPQLIDLNGARASCEGAFAVHGDHRVQAEVLRHIAGAAGRICALSQTLAHPDQLLFDADAVLARVGPSAGLYGARDCFVPQGDPHSHDSDAYVAMVAADVGMTYEHLELRWDCQAGEFLVGNPADAGPWTRLGAWLPKAPVWPYSLDQRGFALAAESTTNPLPFAIATSNKLLAYSLVSRRLPWMVPAFRAAALWRDGAGGAEACALQFSNAQLLVLKPANSLRGFGTVVLPRDALPSLAIELGLAADEDLLTESSHLLGAALLWGDAASLLAVAQEYVAGAPVFHPVTKLPHACIYRATVLSDSVSAPRCIDVNVLLAPLPLTGTQTRDSFIVSASASRCIVRPSSRQDATVRAAAESVVRAFEEQAVAFFSDCNERDMVLREADFLANEVDRQSDVAFADVWDQFRSEVTLRELLESPRH
jgi:hypothetical protein